MHVVGASKRRGQRCGNPGRCGQRWCYKLVGSRRLRGGQASQIERKRAFLVVDGDADPVDCGPVSGAAAAVGPPGALVLKVALGKEGSGRLTGAGGGGDGKGCREATAVIAALQLHFKTDW
eukprot:scaffold12455_cov62-Phaeocystis_antarctica.AAC.5